MPTNKPDIEKIRKDDDAYAFIDLLCKDCPAVVKKYWQVYVDENGAMVSDPKFEDILRVSNAYFKDNPMNGKGWDDPDGCVFPFSREDEDITHEIEDLLDKGEDEKADELMNKQAFGKLVFHYVKESLKDIEPGA